MWVNFNLYFLSAAHAQRDGGNTGGPAAQDRTTDLTGESGDILNVTAAK